MSDPGRTIVRTTLTGNGPDIAIAELGTGRPMILLHGIGSAGSSWMPVMVRLSRKCKLFMVDLRGHGQSGHPESGYELSDYADDLERIVEHTGQAPVILGHSLGGLVAITWARRHPNLAKGIVLEDMPLSGGPDRASTLDGWAWLAALPVSAVIEEYRRDFPDWSEADYLRRAKMITATEQAVFTSIRARTANGTTIDYLDGLDVIKSPIKLIYGDIASGGLVREDGAERFRKLGTNFSATHIPGASHSIHRDATRPFLDAVSEFLNGLEPAGVAVRTTRVGSG